MQLSLRVVIGVSLLGIAPADIGAAEPPEKAAKSSAEVAAKLRIQAEKNDTADISKVFSALRVPKNLEKIGLTREQTRVLTELEKLTRDVIKAWLLRGLDASPLPPADELLDRLSEKGERVRAEIVLHAEAIASEGVLSPAQAAIVGKMTGVSLERRMPGRFGPAPAPASEQFTSTHELVEGVRYFAGTYRRAGFYFFALLGHWMFHGMYPTGTAHLRGRELENARGYMPRVSVPKNQSGLIARLDAVTLDAFRTGMTLGLEKDQPPAREELLRRIVGHTRLSNSLFAHAEAIAVKGILTADQAELCLRALWAERGAKALLDPALAVRLRLSRSQREAVISLLEDRDEVDRQKDSAQGQIMGLIPSRPELRLVDEQIVAEAREKGGQIDDMIWSLLTPSQARALRRILAPPPGPAGFSRKVTGPN